MRKIYSQLNIFMPSIKYKYPLTLIVLLLIQVNVFAGRDEFKKTITETFTVNENTRIEAINKHGDMHIHTWDKDEVSFEVTITVEAKTEADAEKEFDRIDVEFSNVGNTVGAETIWGERETKRRWSFFDWSTWGSGNGWESGNKIRVDYVINMPAANPVDFTNKYGHINFPTLDNDAKITVKYGNMDGEHVGGDFDLNVGYGDACLKTVAGKSEVYVKYGKFCADELAKLDIESKYSKVYLDKTQDITIQSKYDHYELGTVQNLHSDGKYDDFEIEWVKNIKLYSKYSDYRIEELAGTGYLDMEYGNAKINRLAPDFGDLRLDGSYAHFKIKISSGMSFDVNVETSYGDMDFMDDQHIVIQKDGSNREADGYIGSPNSGNRLRARLRYGNLRIW